MISCTHPRDHRGECIGHTGPFVLLARHQVHDVGGEAAVDMVKVVDGLVHEGRDGIAAGSGAVDRATIETVFELVEVRHRAEVRPPFDGTINP